MIVRKEGERPQIVLRRSSDETAVVDYKPFIAGLWDANTNIQVVKDMYDTLSYVVKYCTKQEDGIDKAMNECFKNMDKNTSVKSKMMKVLNCYINSRQVGIFESVMHNLGLPFKQLSRQCKFIPAMIPANRTLSLKRHQDLVNLLKEDKNSEEIFTKNIIQHYEGRPVESYPILRELSLFEFVMFYDLGSKNTKDPGPVTSEDEHNFGVNDWPSFFNLSTGRSAKRRKKFHVVRWPNHRAELSEEQKENYYYSLLLLFMPFENEESLFAQIPEFYDTFEVMFMDKKHFIKKFLFDMFSNIQKTQEILETAYTAVLKKKNNGRPKNSA